MAVAAGGAAQPAINVRDKDTREHPAEWLFDPHSRRRGSQLHLHPQRGRYVQAVQTDRVPPRTRRRSTQDAGSEREALRASRGRKPSHVSRFSIDATCASPRGADILYGIEEV